VTSVTSRTIDRARQESASTNDHRQRRAKHGARKKTTARYRAFSRKTGYGTAYEALGTREQPADAEAKTKQTYEARSENQEPRSKTDTRNHREDKKAKRSGESLARVLIPARGVQSETTMGTPPLRIM
jgi:hypothetical protein